MAERKHYSTASGMIRKKSGPESLLMATRAEEEGKIQEIEMDLSPGLWQSPDNRDSDDEKSERMSSFRSL
jgi:hypothetical protein